ncbi:MAG: hypothetical protein Q9195_007617 [Heterodermia aff. obscurata]
MILMAHLLDDFSNTQISATPTPPVPSASNPNNFDGNLETSDATANVFSKQLQEQMAALLGNMDETPEMKKEIEIMMRELGTAADPGKLDSEPTRTSTPSITSTSGGEDAFQETIRKTMERMQNSGEQAAAAAASDNTDDIMAQMLKEMQSGDPGGEEDFSKMLLSMMEQLTNKDILYEPMKELHDKFPEWMRRNKDDTQKEDLIRYEEQQRIVAEIVGKFEGNDYSDSKAADREYIVERMQKIQAAGSPPSDLVGDLNGTQEALGNLDGGCSQQ